MAFHDALQVAAAIAARAPSSHNCQPWGVGWATDAATRRTASALLAAGEPGGRAAESPDGGSAGATAGAPDGRPGGTPDGRPGGTPDGRLSGTPDESGRVPSRRSEYLVLALDRARELTALPAHATEMLLSCGAHGEILARALAAQGWRADGVRLLGPGATGGTPPFGGDRWPRAWEPLCLLRLSPAPAPPGDLAALRETVGARHTNRGPYRPEAIDPGVLARLASSATESALLRAHPVPGAPVAVRHLVGAPERAALAELVARHGGRDFAHRAAWRETHAYIRRDEAEAARAGDGFTLGQLFGELSPPRRLGMRAALAPATMRLLRHAGYDRFLARQLAAAVRRSPAAVALCFDGSDGSDGSGRPGDPAGPGDFGGRTPDAGSVLRAGAALAGYWLAATRAGLVLHPVSVLLQHEDVRDACERRLVLPGRALFLSRLGYAVTAFPSSHRRSPSLALRRV
ncbi:nitroreductase family protein [Streptomyces griseoaurantiacus]|uniref:RedV protein n=1 Tax=Streptomyces griseoaurantiacus TaxID=68213 RepID=UPI00381F7DBA